MVALQFHFCEGTADHPIRYGCGFYGVVARYALLLLISCERFCALDSMAPKRLGCLGIHGFSSHSAARLLPNCMYKFLQMFVKVFNWNFPEATAILLGHASSSLGIEFELVHLMLDNE